MSLSQRGAGQGKAGQGRAGVPPPPSVGCPSTLPAALVRSKPLSKRFVAARKWLFQQLFAIVAFLLENPLSPPSLRAGQGKGGCEAVMDFGEATREEVLALSTEPPPLTFCTSALHETAAQPSSKGTDAQDCGAVAVH